MSSARFLFPAGVVAVLLIAGCRPTPTASEPRVDLGSLVISEVGACPYVNSPGWIEVYNPTASPTYLSSYTLRSTGWQYLGGTNYSFYDSAVFSLPDITIHPGGYALIRARISDYMADGIAVVYVRTASGIYPNWYDFGGDGGFVELVRDGLTTDFVRFGPSPAVPTTTGEWSGGTAPALPSTGVQADAVKSISRDGANGDTDGAADWSSLDFSTPGGPNDLILPVVDVDADGIPDDNESLGTTFAGLPLHAWGASPGQRDLFVHLDYMNSADEGIIPRREALDRVVAAFAVHAIAVHFDVGDLFDQAPGADPADHDLSDGSHQVPFAAGVTLGEAGDGRANLYAYKYRYMPLARKQIFHYLLFANSQNADGSPGSSGLAELDGNDFLVSLGAWGLSSADQAETNLLVNWQASTLMHELGHNLGLGHGGFEDTNYKPNYYSIMNYLYQLYGLPTIGAGEGDRFHLEWYSSDWWVDLAALVNGPLANPASFKMDFSNGAGTFLNENALDENDGLGRGGGPVDFNNNLATDVGLGMDINDDGLDGTLNNGGGDVLTTLQDFDDWGSLNFFFNLAYWGEATGRSLDDRSLAWTDPVGDDRQRVYPEPPLRVPPR